MIGINRSVVIIMGAGLIGLVSLNRHFIGLLDVFGEMVRVET